MVSLKKESILLLSKELNILVTEFLLARQVVSKTPLQFYSSHGSSIPCSRQYLHWTGNTYVFDS